MQHKIIKKALAALADAPRAAMEKTVNSFDDPAERADAARLAAALGLKISTEDEEENENK